MEKKSTEKKELHQGPNPGEPNKQTQLKEKSGEDEGGKGT